jgi:hypothetical protein
MDLLFGFVFVFMIVVFNLVMIFLLMFEFHTIVVALILISVHLMLQMVAFILGLLKVDAEDVDLLFTVLLVFMVSVLNIGVFVVHMIIFVFPFEHKISSFVVFVLAFFNGN